MRRALALRDERAPARPAFVVHTDIPGNDFMTLGETLETSPDRYDRDRPEVLPLMAARSLYDRVFPPARLHFGWTVSTVHWLRGAPGPIADHAAAQAGFLEAFLGPSFASAGTRPEAERRAALSELWDTARRLIAADPRGVSPRYRLVTALIRRARA